MSGVRLPDAVVAWLRAAAERAAAPGGVEAGLPDVSGGRPIRGAGRARRGILAAEPAAAMRGLAAWVLAVTAVGAAAATGCGKKGPPLAPLRPVPARIEDLTVRRLENDIYLRFTIPSRNQDGTTPADLSRVEVYAITGPPEDQFGRSLDGRGFARYGARVAAIEVEPPPPPQREDEPPPPPRPPDPRPAQGEPVTVVERLSPAVMTPWVHPKRAEVERKRQEQERARPAAPWVGPLVPPRVEVLARVYVAAGRSRRGELGPLSARLAVPLTDPPDPPGQPAVTYTEQSLSLSWTPPPTARRRVQEPAPPAAAAPPGPAGQAGPAAPPAEPPPLPGRPTFAGAIPHTYNVYRFVSAEPDGQAVMPVPLNPRPLEAPRFEETPVAFGVERCYVVRMVEVVGLVTVESAPSPPACVTPRDTFPPAAPRNLAAVASEGAISLIWEANGEPDLAGYLVLRGEAGAGRLDAITPSPIRETTFRDEGVRPGVRYVYAVVAVDAATPANVSAESNRVEETAR